MVREWETASDLHLVLLLCFSYNQFCYFTFLLVWLLLNISFFFKSITDEHYQRMVRCLVRVKALGVLRDQYIVSTKCGRYVEGLKISFLLWCCGFSSANRPYKEASGITVCCKWRHYPNSPVGTVNIFRCCPRVESYNSFGDYGLGMAMDWPCNFYYPRSIPSRYCCSICIRTIPKIAEVTFMACHSYNFPSL